MPNVVHHRVEQLETEKVAANIFAQPADEAVGALALRECAESVAIGAMQW
jgi:hypothetical protein